MWNDCLTCYIGNAMASLFLPSGAAVFSLGFSQQRDLETLTPIATTCIRKQTKISGNGRTRELQNHTVPAIIWQSITEKSKTSHSIQLIKTQYLKTALKTCIIKYQCNGCLEWLVRQGFNLFYRAEYQLLLCLGRGKKIHLKGILLYSVQLWKCKA